MHPVRTSDISQRLTEEEEHEGDTHEEDNRALEGTS